VRKLLLFTFVLFTFNSVMAVSSNDEVIIKEAKAAYIEKNYEEVYRLTYDLVEKNNPAAYNLLALLLENGNVVEQDEQKAFDLYLKSAMLGYPAAQYNIGRFYEFGKSDLVPNIGEALEWHYLAADKDYVYAQYRLGLAHKTGTSVKQDNYLAFDWFQKAANLDHKESQNELAYMHYQGIGTDKNQKIAFDWWTKSAEQGLSISQYNLGVIYDNGSGVKENDMQAVKWYRKAAEQGNAEAQNAMGNMHYNGNGTVRDNKTAVRWYRKAAEQGLADAQQNLGWMYDNGYGLPKNKKQAFSWFRKAAKQEHANAQYNLAVMYEKGKGVYKDARQAAKWYRKAAEQGYVDAQNALGGMYHNGNGIAKDNKKAVKWYRKAANQGLRSAQYNLGVMYENGTGVEQDYVQALSWYDKAMLQGQTINKQRLSEIRKFVKTQKDAVKGNIQSQFELAMIYFEGKYKIKKDFKLAFKWFNSAAIAGNVSSQAKLGDMYYSGNGVDKDYAKSAIWYKKAALQGDGWSQYSLGWANYQGEGVTQDYKEARKWFIKAADKGYADAQYRLGEIYSKGLGQTTINLKKASKWYKAAAENDIKEALLPYVKIKSNASGGLNSDSIGKWYSGTSCDKVVDEYIILNDQILVKKYSKYLDIGKDLHFFPNNVITESNNTDIEDWHFKSLKFPSLSKNPSYKAKKLLSCESLNANPEYIMLEHDAIEFDKLIASMPIECTENGSMECIEYFMNFADVSKDENLSLAELTRLMRFTVKWLTLKGELDFDERLGTSAITTTIAPIMSQLMLANYDYDDNGQLSVSEMTYDMVSIASNSELEKDFIRRYLGAKDSLSGAQNEVGKIIRDLIR